MPNLLFYWIEFFIVRRFVEHTKPACPIQLPIGWTGETQWIEFHKSTVRQYHTRSGPAHNSKVGPATPRLASLHVGLPHALFASGFLCSKISFSDKLNASSCSSYDALWLYEGRGCKADFVDSEFWFTTKVPCVTRFGNMKIHAAIIFFLSSFLPLLFSASAIRLQK